MADNKIFEGHNILYSDLKDSIIMLELILSMLGLVTSIACNKLSARPKGGVLTYAF